MGVRFTCAKAVSSVSTWGLKHVFRRPAANFPGKVALYVDPQLITHLRERCTDGTMFVVGTNGKTTVTNLIADMLEAAGHQVVCNRTGANLDSGVTTALLHTKQANWGVFESDELWLAKMLPQMQADYVLLLNLFRDQLDRCGEIDRIQDSIVSALSASPSTVLVLNADDPLCARIAAQAPNKHIAFGLVEDLHLPQNTVADAQMCQLCDGMLHYDYRQYGQLGSYRCTSCDFARPVLDYEIDQVEIGEMDLRFRLSSGPGSATVTAPFGGAYMVYNLGAVSVMGQLLGVKPQVAQGVINKFSPDNGRLQKLTVGNRPVLLNLAKNPTGFNQNLKLVTAGQGPRAVGFFINDKEADGHDISWLWDIDFEELAARGDVIAFAGGIRARDMQVRLKYAGIDAQVVESATQMFEKLAGVPEATGAYVIANYTALPQVKADVEKLAATGAPVNPQAEAPGYGHIAPPEPAAGKPVVIAHLFPDLLNLYGDGGNVTVLQRRLQWRGIPVEVRQVHHGQHINLCDVDLVFMGGGPDREQKLASEDLVAMVDDLRKFVEEDGALLAICGGYQILGHKWLWGDDEVPGLGIVDMETRRPGTSADRLIDNIVLASPVAQHPVVGFENHAGRTYLGQGVQPFGQVISQTGGGNNEDSKADGVRYKGVIGTYCHGPLLGKNPEVADYLLRQACARNAQRTGQPAWELEPLSDQQELGANASLCQRFHCPTTITQ